MKNLMMLLALLCVIVTFSSTVNAGLNDGLVAYWPFDNNADDLVGGNNGTLVGGASYVVGKLGQAVSTSNQNTQDYVEFDTTSDGLTGAWTVAAWIYVHNQDVGGFIDGYFGDPADDDCYGLRLPGAYGAVPHPGMADYVNNINASWDGEDSQTQAYETPAGTWTLMVYAGSDTQCELFADGVSQGTMVFAETKGTHGSSTSETDPNMQFKLTWDRLGNMVKYPSFGNAVADYDELVIWNRTLSESEVAELYNGGAGKKITLDPNLPSVDAGVNLITWSGQTVQLDPNVVEAPGSDWTGFTYLWTAEPNGIGDPNLDVAITGATTEDASVTITKAEPTENATIITMTLAVGNAGNPSGDPVTDSMKIAVYDDACLAAKAAGPVVIARTDFDENCITDFKDFAVMATTWLDDYTLTSAVAK